MSMEPSTDSSPFTAQIAVVASAVPHRIDWNATVPCDFPTQSYSPPSARTVLSPILSTLPRAYPQEPPDPWWKERTAILIIAPRTLCGPANGVSAAANTRSSRLSPWTANTAYLSTFTGRPNTQTPVQVCWTARMVALASLGFRKKVIIIFKNNDPYSFNTPYHGPLRFGAS